MELSNWQRRGIIFLGIDLLSQIPAFLLSRSPGGCGAAHAGKHELLGEGVRQMELDWTKVVVEITKAALLALVEIWKDWSQRRAKEREKMTKAPARAPRHRTKSKSR